MSASYKFGLRSWCGWSWSHTGTSLRTVSENRAAFAEPKIDSISGTLNRENFDNSSVELKALPSNRSGNEYALEVDGKAVALESLGPIVVNVDGTIQQISNWEAMSEVEKATCMRLVAKRNKERLAALKQVA